MVRNNKGHENYQKNPDAKFLKNGDSCTLVYKRFLARDDAG